MTLENIVSTAVDTETFQKLQRYCSRNNLYRSEVLRDALEEHLERKEREETLIRLKDLRDVVDKLGQIKGPGPVAELLEDARKVLDSLSPPDMPPETTAQLLTTQ